MTHREISQRILRIIERYHQPVRWEDVFGDDDLTQQLVNAMRNELAEDYRRSRERDVVLQYLREMAELVEEPFGWFALV